VATFDFDALAVAPGRAPLPYAVAFAASAAERLTWHAQRYFDLEGDSQLRTTFERALESLWAFATTQQSAEGSERDAALHQLLEGVERAEDSPHEGCMFAADAMAAVAYGLRAIAGCNPREAASAAVRSYDSISRVAEDELPEPLTAAQIEAHPLVQTELARQAADVASLERWGLAVDPASLWALRQRAQEDAKTALARPKED
jgi:hypothetical protein